MAHFLNKLKRITFLLILSSLSFDSFAIEVEALYRVEIGVDDQSKKSLLKASLTGFKEVLIRKSGSRDILSAYEVQQAYPKVKGYLQRFEYNRINQNALFVNESHNEIKAFELLLDFEPRLIDQLIQSAGMPIWGSNRPLTILWLVIEQDFKREIIKENNKLSELINTNAIRRGIPLLLPLMDLEDQLSVSISDIWGRFASPVSQASQRYAADSILTGRISQIGNEWQAKLVYISEGQEQRLLLKELSQENLFIALTDRLAEILCEKYCVVEAAERHQIVMQVSNINNFFSFKQMEKYLSGLSSIRQVNINKISATNIRLGLSLLGDIQAVKEALRLGNKLIEDSEANKDLFKLKETIDNTNLSLEIIQQVSNPQPPAVDKYISEKEFIKTSQSSDETEPSNIILYYRWVE